MPLKDLVEEDAVRESAEADSEEDAGGAGASGSIESVLVALGGRRHGLHPAPAVAVKTQLSLFLAGP
jgi:hypothetical protein